jgi:hypothetical protein
MRTIKYAAAALAVVGALLCGVAWSLSSPVGSSPDDDYHVTSIWCADPDDVQDCAPGAPSAEGEPNVTVPGLVASGSCYAMRSEESGACQGALPDSVTTARVDAGTYPGGFYRVMHVFVGDEVGRSVVTMRIFNVTLAVALILATMLAGTPTTRRLQAYVVTCAMIPLGWFVAASVNPSSWAVTGVTVLGFALHSLYLVAGRGRIVANIVLALLGAMLALVARGDAAVFVGVVAAAVSVLHWRTLWARRTLLVVPALVCLAGLFFLFNAQVSSVASAGAQTDRTRGETLLALALDFPTLVGGMFGSGFGLGWLDTPVHSITAFSAVVVVGFLGMSGIGFGGRAKALASVMLVGAMLLIPLVTLYRLRMIVGETVQPRYILPLMPIALLVLLSGPRRGDGLRLSRVQAWVIWLLMSLAQSAAIYANTRRYVTGLDGPLIIDNVEWWWAQGPSPLMNWLIGSIGFAVAALVLIGVSRPTPEQADAAARTVSLGADSETATPRGEVHAMTRLDAADVTAARLLRRPR